MFPHVKLMIQPILGRTYHKHKICRLMPTWHSKANCYETIMFGRVTYKLDAAAMRVCSYNNMKFITMQSR